MKAQRSADEAKAERAMSTARSGLILSRDAKSAFFSVLGMRLKAVPSWDCPTLVTDGTELRYNPTFFAGLTKRQQTTVVVHEIMHCAMQHHTRRESRQPRKWNIACDLAINDILSKSGYEMPQPATIPGNGEYMNFPSDLSAEQYYAMLPDEKDGDGEGEGNGDGSGDGSGPSDPGGCGAVADAGDRAQQEQSQAEWKVAVAQAENVAKQRGDMPAGLQRFVGEVVHPAADWKELLRRFVSQAARNDYAWFPPNRRYIHMGFYLPSIRSEEIGEVVVAVDTSGSIGDRELAMFASELEAMTAAYDMTLRILYHDSRVASEETWTPHDGPLSLEPKGGGGTDHRPVFERVAELLDEGESPECVICLTDGYTVFPDGCDLPVMWCMTTGQDAPFGEVININA